MRWHDMGLGLRLTQATGRRGRAFQLDSVEGLGFLHHHSSSNSGSGEAEERTPGGGNLLTLLSSHHSHSPCRHRGAHLAAAIGGWHPCAYQAALQHHLLRESCHGCHLSPPALGASEQKWVGYGDGEVWVWLWWVRMDRSELQERRRSDCLIR